VKRIWILVSVAAIAIGCGKSEEPAPASGVTQVAPSSDSRFEKLNQVRNAGPETIARACDEHSAGDLPPDLREVCASAHYDLARNLVEQEDAKGARAALDRARQEGFPTHRITAMDRDVKALEKKIELREGMAKREDTAHKVANVFQYRGMEVRTQLSGEYKENITIEYPGMSSETADQLRTDEYVIGPLREAGVKNVTFTDGSGYSTTVKLD
jgi:hypothetical protein